MCWCASIIKALSTLIYSLQLLLLHRPIVWIKCSAIFFLAHTVAAPTWKLWPEKPSGQKPACWHAVLSMSKKKPLVKGALSGNMNNGECGSLFNCSRSWRNLYKLLTGPDMASTEKYLIVHPCRRGSVLEALRNNCIATGWSLENSKVISPKHLLQSGSKALQYVVNSPHLSNPKKAREQAAFIRISL